MTIWRAGRILTTVGWVAAVGAVLLASFLPESVVDTMVVVLWVMGLSHLVEFAIVLPVLRRAGVALSGPFCGTFFWGAFYMIPLRRRLLAGPSDPETATPLE